MPLLKNPENCTSPSIVNAVVNLLEVLPNLEDNQADIEWLLENPEIFKCLGPFYVLLPQLGITDINSISKLCGNSPITDDDPPGCEGCSVGEAQIVLGDDIKAKQMLDCAIEKLSNYNGTTPNDVKVALSTNFGGEDSELFGSLINFTIKYIKFMAIGCEYEAQDNGTGNCGAGTVAWTNPSPLIFSNVRLCRPNYWNESPLERSATLIHEWLHLYHGSADLAYDWEPDYSDLSTMQQLVNADSFSEFVKYICP